MYKMIPDPFPALRFGKGSGYAGLWSRQGDINIDSRI